MLVQRSDEFLSLGVVAATFVGHGTTVGSGGGTSLLAGAKSPPPLVATPVE